MHTAYVRELKPYSLAALASEFAMNLNDALKIIGDLMVNGIIRYHLDTTLNDGNNSDEEKEAKPNEKYQFVFVGMVIIHDLVLISYPKYFRNRKPTDEELRQIFRLLKRNADKTSICRVSEDGKQTNDKLSIMLALLDLYAEYGVYSNFVEGRELNGTGVTDWNRTIGNHLPILIGNRPIYIEYETYKTFQNEADYITRLHRAVLTECSQELFKANVGDLLSFDEICLSDENVDDLGDAETLEWRLENEHSSQFIDWKIMALNLLKRYLLARENTTELDEINAFGTTSFFNIWERACKVAFGDVLNSRLDDLGLPLVGDWNKLAYQTLLKIIPQPKWERYVHGRYNYCGASATLIPDTISFTYNNKGEYVFCIYDAKYYVPSESGEMKYQPGLESVTKQFLYQSAYESFIKDYKFDTVVNAFLVPTAEKEMYQIGRVSFTEVMGEVERPLSNFVTMWALPANQIFNAYLNGEQIDKVGV